MLILHLLSSLEIIYASLRIIAGWFQKLIGYERVKLFGFNFIRFQMCRKAIQFWSNFMHDNSIDDFIYTDQSKVCIDLVFVPENS